MVVAPIPQGVLAPKIPKLDNQSVNDFSLAIGDRQYVKKISDEAMSIQKELDKYDKEQEKQQNKQGILAPRMTDTAQNPIVNGMTPDQTIIFREPEELVKTSPITRPIMTEPEDAIETVPITETMPEDAIERPDSFEPDSGIETVPIRDKTLDDIKYTQKDENKDENKDEIETETSKGVQLEQEAKKYDSADLEKWFGNSQAIDEAGKPKVLYSGHSNVAMYGDKYDPKKSTAGGFYVTENPEIASNYALVRS